MRNQSFKKSGIASIVAVVTLSLFGPEHFALAQDSTDASQADPTQLAPGALAFLQEANNAPAVPASVPPTSVPAVTGDDSATASDGQALYAQTCVACHGANGKGAIPGVADFTTADSPLLKSDAELLRNISEGFQSPGSFMAMPAKGGNPKLTDVDVRALLAYLRAEFVSQ